MTETIQRFLDAVETCVRPLTKPVGIKLAAEGEAAPPKTKRPLEHLKRRMTVCQGLTAARTLGWTMAFGADDHGCPMPKVFAGHIPPDRLLTGQVADFYQADPEVARAMEASYPRWPEGRYREIWLAPLDRCAFEPHVVVVYGNPAQVLALIQAGNFGVGTGVRSVSSGRFGCSAWIAGVAQSGECTYLVPGPGERVFAGTQDHEMAFAAPAGALDRVAAGLNHVRRGGAYRYPVPNLAALSEPQMPPKYHEIDPTHAPD
ncbi:DUF169 domain-containing protein [Deferrisoma sp.]